MLHSGSRGVGNRMGSYFIELARKDMERFFMNLPDVIWPISRSGTEHFDDYVEAVEWAQDYARLQPRADDGADRGRGARFRRACRRSARN